MKRFVAFPCYFPKTGRTFYFTVVCKVKVWCESKQALEDLWESCKTMEDVVQLTVPFMDGREGWEKGQRILFVDK